MDLIKERSNQTLDIEAMHRAWLDLNFMEGLSVAKINKHKDQLKQLGAYPTMDYYYMDREQRMNDETKRACILYEYLSNKGVLQDRTHVLSLALAPHYFGLAYQSFFFHFDGFVKTIQLLGDEEQIRKWVPRSYAFQVIGCYAQTELGHGSDVRNLETTATYDKDTEEFILNSPTTSSIKFWAGGLGKMANHAIVQAQTSFGVQTFIVQIRDDDHLPVDNVHVGDVGTKFSFNSTDNGFLKFNNLRIPRENMLSKYTKITPKGEVTMADPKAVRLGYGNMLFLRVWFYYFRCMSLSKLATIAIRYSIVRKQFKNAETGEERQILDYQTQQYRLFPILGVSYAICLSSRNLIRMYTKYEKELKEGNEPFDLLRQIHAL